MSVWTDFRDSVRDGIKSIVSAGTKIVRGALTFNFDDIKEGYQELYRDVYAPLLEPVFNLIGITDETIYAVEVITSPLIKDKEAKYIQTSILSAIREDRDLVEEIKFAIITGQRATVKRYVDYGKAHYTFGVPEVTVSEYFIDNDEVVLHLTEVEGEPVTIVKSELAIPTSDFWGQYYLYINEGLDPDTLLFTWENYEWLFNQAIYNESNDTYTISASRFEEDPPTVIFENYFPNIPAPEEGSYYSVTYTVDSDPTVIKMWSYEIGSNVYPQFNDDVIGGDTDNLNSLPIMPLRQNFISVNADKESQEYITSKRLMETLDLIELDDLIDDIEQNRDIAAIQEAFLLFGVNLYSEDKDSLKYLYNFFFMLSVIPSYAKETFLALSERGKSISTFTYSIKEARFNTIIGFNYIDAREIAGTIGKLGFIKTEFTILPNTLKESVNDPGNAGKTPEELSEGLLNSLLTISLQVTEDSYVDIEVGGLNLFTSVFTEGTSVLTKIVELVDPTNTSTEALAARANFIIPLSYYILEQMSPMEAEQVIYDALNIVIYAQQSEELEYYQTADFLQFISIALKIAAAVIFVGSLTTGAPISSVLLTIAQQLLIQIALTFALKEILTHHLSDAEKAAVFVLYVLASYGAADYAVGVDLALSFADTLILIVNAISTFIEIDTAMQTEELLEDQEEFNTLRSSKDEELEAAEDYLNTDGSIDTFQLLNSRVVPVLDTWTTPQEFYDKSLTTNVASIVLSQTGSYVSSALDLNNIRPDLSSRTIIEDLDSLTDLT